MSGDQAVARVLAAILSERHPGTTWLPVETAEVGVDTGSGQTIRCLAAPEDADAAGIQPAVATVDLDATDEHAIDARGEQTAPLSDG